MTLSTRERKITRRPEGMAGLAKGLAILELFGPRSRRITAAEAAQATKVTRAAARRCLLTLVSLNYLSYDGKFFTPAPRLLRLSSAYLSGYTLASEAGPILDRLRDSIRESVSLAVADGDEVLFIARAPAPRVVSAAVQIGTRWPMYCTAAGRVLLSARSPKAVKDYLSARKFEKKTNRTVTSISKLRQVVEQTRHQGYGFSDEEIEIGLRAVAVPVYTSGGVIAAMTVSTSSARMSTAEMIKKIVPALKQAASAFGPAQAA
jgi:IclR family transcriptional regulator, pca regulon regulatory protein